MSPPKPMPAYDGYATPAEFDLGYQNGIDAAVVARWEAVYRADSDRTLAARPDLRPLRYGPGERNAIDFFPARGVTGPAPTLVAIHGGLWFLFDKWKMHFLADVFTAHGVHVACPNYGLAPGQDLGAIVADCRRAVGHLQKESQELGIDPARLSVLGHSAAGQLAALVAADETLALHRCVGVSGFYDVEPFAGTGFHPLTGFSPDAYRAWNPLRHVTPRLPPTLLITGSLESSLIQQMTAHYAAALRAAAVPVEVAVGEGECHFSVLHEIGNPRSALFRRVLAAVRD